MAKRKKKRGRKKRIPYSQQSKRGGDNAGLFSMDANSCLLAFHEHLDDCRQCRDNPFRLCTVGSMLMAGTKQ